MEQIIIDCAGITTRQALHEALASALRFPAYYGRNLDALYDCLTETAQETHLQLLNFAALQPALGDYARKLQLVLQDAEEANLCFHVTIQA